MGCYPTNVAWVTPRGGKHCSPPAADVHDGKTNCAPTPTIIRPAHTVLKQRPHLCFEWEVHQVMPIIGKATRISATGVSSALAEGMVLSSGDAVSTGPDQWWICRWDSMVIGCALIPNPPRSSTSSTSTASRAELAWPQRCSRALRSTDDDEPAATVAPDA